MSEQLIRFHCPGCNKKMKAPAMAAGRTGTCPACSMRMVIPTPVGILATDDLLLQKPTNDVVGHTGRQNLLDDYCRQGLPKPATEVIGPTAPVPPSVSQVATVPLKVSLPKGGGTVQTQVSQSAADAIVYTALGGVLVGGALVGAVALIVACPPLAGALAAAAGAAASGKKA